MDFSTATHAQVRLIPKSYTTHKLILKSRIFYTLFLSP
ncbi:hypothetical protein HFN_2420 [Helicobacter fennelliae MRY12-0050]|uniref:Uncharacterized protein n=1 Tax=Helicobacter fennelliae MRY12-0050 TaxID=1325130 RepID=T1DVF3_9HELI|nr:hypothetical protein HFN_2420 [Helicobacter fennelliae MRY12-0050]